MKQFQEPDVQVIHFAVQDIITSSDDLPFVPYAISEDDLELAEL